MGVPRVRTSVVCVHLGKLLAFEAEDPKTRERFVFLPGGKVEAEESAPEAAERETLEETGFKVQVDPSSGIDREYTFLWDGVEYDCLTIFYKGFLRSPLQSVIQDQTYHRGVIWVPVEAIESRFHYSPEICSAILELVNK